eukprot:Rhum_TRINITY_DN7820_c0_g2::Rhum_TRINITY_DN7820_c0_g2_i1::g.24825::m.24825
MRMYVYVHVHVRVCVCGCGGVCVIVFFWGWREDQEHTNMARLFGPSFFAATPRRYSALMFDGSFDRISAHTARQSVKRSHFRQICAQLFFARHVNATASSPPSAGAASYAFRYIFSASANSFSDPVWFPARKRALPCLRRRSDAARQPSSSTSTARQSPSSTAANVIATARCPFRRPRSCSGVAPAAARTAATAAASSPCTHATVTAEPPAAGVTVVVFTARAVLGEAVAAAAAAGGAVAAASAGGRAAGCFAAEEEVEVVAAAEDEAPQAESAFREARQRERPPPQRPPTRAAAPSATTSPDMISFFCGRGVWCQ